MLNSPSPPPKIVKLSKQERLELELIQEARFKQARLQDVQLILQNLTEREEATVKMILDCLYDVGSINLINKKIRFRPLNRLLKAIATKPKPIFRILGFYWFKKNCPKLITDWLADQVTF